MGVYVYVHVCVVCTCVRTHVCVSVYVHVSTSVRKYLCVHESVRVYRTAGARHSGTRHRLRVVYFVVTRKGPRTTVFSVEIRH